MGFDSIYRLGGFQAITNPAVAVGAVAAPAAGPTAAELGIVFLPGQVVG